MQVATPMMEADDGEIDVEMLERVDRKLKRDENTRYLVRYRKAKKDEMRRLRQTVATLEALRMQLTSGPRALAWQDVAKALHDHRHVAESHNKALRARLEQHKGLVQTMQAWVGAHLPIQVGLDARCWTWRNVSLFGNAASRTLGKKWITMQMFHNTERVFEQYNFPAFESTDELWYDLKVEFGDQGYTSVRRRQYTDSSMEFDQVVPWIHRSFLRVQAYIPQYDVSQPLELEEIEGHTKQYVVITPANEYCNVLVGEYLTENRFLYCIQQIQADERCDAGDRRQRNRTMWYDIHRRPGGGTKRRMLMMVSQLLPSNDGEIVSLDDDARSWGINLEDCPDHLKESRFPLLWRYSNVKERLRLLENFLKK
ncbi:Aste57867_75 [Aphanomyces stellatus]|uniref:Aste57867_75 protein n=1 Tax=Aphanomyces stellatus TaxID=120398 RepID=A0A485K1W4_9STRA|nr:hypothetical protein As57867_000075 [Aphanomyces stellatus]VFT77301.1 Aste57867_75 [Aphanomyces stellatus]